MVTPNELAAVLGVSPLKLRNFLRSEFRRPAAQWHTRWELTLPMIVAAARELG